MAITPSTITSLEPRLRRLLRMDATLCVTTGVVGAALAKPAAALLDTTGVGLVLLGSVLLAVYGLALAVLAGGPAIRVVPTATLSAWGDAAWILGSITLVLSGAISPRFLVLSLPVAALGLAKGAGLSGRGVLGRRRAGRPAAASAQTSAPTAAR